MKVKIKFWKSGTKDTLKELWDILVTDAGMSKEQANEYVEKIYRAVASEFGD